jgi:tetratricopeptide (TPR) repeat protein
VKPPSIEAITLLGDTLYTSVSTSEDALKKYDSAKANYEKDSNDAEALIWYGRRTAYLGKFQEAIAIYSEGIEKHPTDARMYRHRGHRYISTRQYAKAIADFEKAVTLIEDTEDQVEPDGLPNDRNIPLSTLHGNIWYHLGLAYYLQNDMENALKAYSNRTVTERYPDNLVSGGYWLYMINRRLGNIDAANAAIEKVVTNMDIIENGSYYNMCLFFKGLIPEEDITNQTIGTSSSDVLAYGLGNWYLYEKQDTAKAKVIYKRLLEKGNKYSFAYLVAESDYKRLFAND